MPRLSLVPKDEIQAPKKPKSKPKSTTARMEFAKVTVKLPLALHAQLLAQAEERNTDISTLVRMGLYNLSRRPRLYTLASVVGFGKYRDESMESVIRCDPGYIHWAVRVVESFNLDTNCKQLLGGMN